MLVVVVADVAAVVVGSSGGAMVMVVSSHTLCTEQSVSTENALQHKTGFPNRYCPFIFSQLDGKSRSLVQVPKSSGFG